MRSRAIFTEPDERGPVAILRVGMTVERVDRDVGSRPGEPFVMNAVPLEDLVPGLAPDELPGGFGPEGIGIALKAVALGGPVLQQRLLLHDCRSGILVDGVRRLGRAPALQLTCVAVPMMKTLLTTR